MPLVSRKSNLPQDLAVKLAGITYKPEVVGSNPIPAINEIQRHEREFVPFLLGGKCQFLCGGQGAKGIF